MSRNGLAALALLVVVALAFLTPLGVDASGHSAERSFARSWVAPGGEIQVTLVVMDYGVLGQVEETLPAGFSYVESSLPPAAVNAANGVVTFTLLGDAEFTYTVEAPAAAGSYAFSGVVRDQAREETQVGGQARLRVGPPPTPTPVPTATPTPEPTAIPEPTPTPVPTAAPPPTDTPRPTATPVPTATPLPTATPEPTATATPEPEPTQAATPTPEPTATASPEPAPTSTQEPVSPPSPEPTPAAEPPDEESELPLLPIAVAVGLVVVLVAIVFIRRRSR